MWDSGGCRKYRQICSFLVTFVQVLSSASCSYCIFCIILHEDSVFLCGFSRFDRFLLGHPPFGTYFCAILTFFDCWRFCFVHLFRNCWIWRNCVVRWLQLFRNCACLLRAGIWKICFFTFLVRVDTSGLLDFKEIVSSAGCNYSPNHACTWGVLTFVIGISFAIQDFPSPA